MKFIDINDKEVDIVEIQAAFETIDECKAEILKDRKVTTEALLDTLIKNVGRIQIEA